MAEIKFELDGFRCERCAHEWLPKKVLKGSKKPMVCPKCKSPYWNTPKEVKNEEKKE
jgi:predicted Zn-ribbon and HTH transcriptional regulator